jgi:predicted  nucleic acid-binding Zn-ribbon protein
MKCPRCGEELRRSKKDPSYGLCDNCRKKFKWVDDDDYEDDYEEDDEEEQVRPAPQKRKSSSQNRSYKSAPPEKKKGGCLKVVLIVIAILIVLGILIAVFGGGDDKVKDVTPAKSNTEQSSNKDTQKAATKEEKKTEFAVGETAEYKNVQVSVLNYEESAGNEWGAPAEGNVFIFANIEIANNTDEEISVSSMGSFDAYCDDYKLDYSSEALMAASIDNRQQMDGSISPGKKLNGYLGFEVPAGWKTIEINYKDNFWLDSNFKFILNK